MTHTVLVVDDESFNRQITINVLEEIGHELSILSADSGILGCELAEKLNPDLILMDWKMPSFSGYQALLRLKAQTTTMHIPVIMCTGVTNEEELKEAIEIGAVGAISKPIDKEQLKQMINDILNTN